MNESVLRHSLEEATRAERIKAEGTIFVAATLFKARRRVRICKEKMQTFLAKFKPSSVKQSIKSAYTKCKDTVKSFSIKQSLFIAALTSTIYAGLAYGWISRKVSSFMPRKESPSAANA
jgi:hypothetical protein